MTKDKVTMRILALLLTCLAPAYGQQLRTASTPPLVSAATLQELVDEAAHTALTKLKIN